MNTYHDVFVEQLIRRERLGGEFLFRCGAVLAGLILIALAYLLAGPFFPFFFALIIILEFFAFVYTVKEFEYSFTSGDVDVDMIQGRRRRRTQLSFPCKSVTLMAPVEGHEAELGGDFAKTVDASISKKAEGRWFVVTQREDGSRELLILNPNERLLAAFKGYLGRRMEYTLPPAHRDTAE
jgi:hypothetical protein